MTTDRSLFRASLAGFGLLVALAGCSRQGEGERCSLLNGNQDCSGGLVCTPAGELRGGDDSVDRCCPADEASNVDPRCRPRVGGSGQSGTGGTGAAQTGEGGEGGSAD